jgi:hypothetical protein
MLLAISDDDLRSEEHAIIAAALSGVPTELLRSETLDWADRIADRITGPGRLATTEAEPQPRDEMLYQGTP